MNMNMKLCFIMTCILCVNWTVQADQLLNEWKNTISSVNYRNNVEINLLSSLVKRLELLENNNIIDLPKLEKRINDLEVEVNELKEYKENTQKKLYSLEQTNQALIEHINKCNQEIDVIKRSSLSVLDMQNNNIRSNNAGTRHLLSTPNNNQQQHSGITMNDGTSIRFIQNNDANTVELSHENGVLKLNGTLQLNNDINDVNNAIKDLQSHVSSTTKTINVPSDYATISAAIASLKPVHYNSVIIQLAPGTYNENVLVENFVIPKGLTIKGNATLPNSYIVTTTSSLYAFSIDSVSNILIDGILINGSNGIYVKNSNVQLGTVTILTTDSVGIYCDSQSFLYFPSTSVVNIVTSKYGILVNYGAQNRVEGKLTIEGPGKTVVNSYGFYASYNSAIYCINGNISISSFATGLRVRLSSQYIHESANSELYISDVMYGATAYTTGLLYFGHGRTTINVPIDGSYAILTDNSQASLLESVYLSTPAGSSAPYAILARYNSHVRITSTSSISANWSVNKIYIAEESVVDCDGSSCPAYGTGVSNAKVLSLSFYAKDGSGTCASSSNDCSSV